MKYFFYFFWNTIGFHETLYVFFAWRVWTLLLLVYHVAFSLFYQGKYLFRCIESLNIHLEKPFFLLGDDTFNRGKHLIDNVTTVSFSSTRQFSSTIFDAPWPSKNCYTLSDYFHLVTFQTLNSSYERFAMISHFRNLLV